MIRAKPMNQPSFSDYQELKISPFVGHRRLLYSDEVPPKTLHLNLQGHKKKPAILGTVIFGTHSEGPPKHTHGGMISYVLDEAMGSVAWHAGKKVVAETIEIKFRKMIPLYEKFYVDAHVIKTVKNNVYVKASIFNSHKQVLSYSKGRFRILSVEKLQAFEKFTRDGSI